MRMPQNGRGKYRIVTLGWMATAVLLLWTGGDVAYGQDLMTARGISPTNAGLSPRPAPPAAPTASGASAVALIYTNPAMPAAASPAYYLQFGTGVPFISTINPSSATAGSPAFNLSVQGGNFSTSSVVRWDGASRNTTVLSSSSLSALITAGDVAVAGTAIVSVVNQDSGNESNAVIFTITPSGNPAPLATSLVPSQAKAGSGALDLSVTGSDFVNGAVVRWNESNRTTTFISSTKLNAEILASDLASEGTANVTVVNPLPGGGISNTLVFRITPAQNPLPVINTLIPATVSAAGAGFTLQVRGENFADGAEVRWNGSPRGTGFINSGQLTASILASDIAAAGTAQVSVVNPPPGGGTSNTINLTIGPPNNPLPSVTHLTPAVAVANGAGFTMVVHGSNFVNSSVVRWNGQDRQTVVESSSVLKAAIPATDLTTAGEASVTVFNPSPGGGLSSERTVTICSGTCITEISPDSVIPGGPEFQMQVFGNGFFPGALPPEASLRHDASNGRNQADAPSKVLWNGQQLPTTFVSSTQLTATVAASLIAATGSVNVTVTTSTGGSNSIPLPITLSQPVPAINKVTPDSVSPGSGQVTLAIEGRNFLSSSKLLWNGAERSTTFNGSTQIQAIIPAADISKLGTANLVVANPTPGGGQSNSQTFRINNFLLFPRLVSSDGDSVAAPDSEYTGIAVVNLSNQNATLTFTGYDRAGPPISGSGIINPAIINLAAGNQLPVIDFQVFGSALTAKKPVGWFKTESTASNVFGFFLMFNGDLTVLDGADVSARTVKTVVLPEVEPAGFTQIHLANPDLLPATVLFELYRGDGTLRASSTQRTVNPNAAVAELFTALFPGVTPSGGDYIRAVSSRGVVVFEFLGKKGLYVEGLNGQDGEAGSTVLYSPQYVVGGSDYWTALSVVNLETTPSTVTFRFIGDDGTQIGATQARTLAGRGKLWITDQAFFVDAGATLRQGYVEIRSDGAKLAGSVVFGDPARNRFSAALPLTGVLTTKVVYGQLASDSTYFTGLAMLNPGTGVANATIEVYDEKGVLIATKQESIGAGRRVSKLLTQYFPEMVGQNRSVGYFRVTVDRGLVGFALFGTNKLDALSAIPPQEVP